MGQIGPTENYVVTEIIEQLVLGIITRLITITKGSGQGQHT